jgi:hypothetical protein
MSKVDIVERHTTKHEQIPLQRVAVSSQEEAYPDSAGNLTLYVLGFGVLGAIFTNALVLIYFASFYMSG